MTWTQRPSDADWDQLIAGLRKSESVVCVAHVSPDGDALGSALGAALAMRAVGIEAVVSFDEDPLVLPGSLRWLPGQELLRSYDDLPAGRGAVVSFDASDLARLGRFAHAGAKAEFFAAVDHHRSYTGFAEVSIVDVSAPATAVLALELVDRLGVELSRDIAACIYVGLTTDTGSFRFAGTTSATHLVAARLHDAGIAHDEIAREVFDTAPFAAVKLLGDAIAGAALLPAAAAGLGIAWTTVTKAQREVLGLSLDAAEPIIDTIRTTSEAEVAVVIKEGDDGVWRVSTRSKGLVDLGLICADLGGGGHRFAAGFSSTMNPPEIIAALSAAIDASAVTQ
ncbi:MAG: bifunctional oligoribonuclease/PAP phosphatase NrnA [Actinobacteria bacterium]|nr:bifunctional oligoribonuclease/PAP phosphatase NrnA [Actinomycetota bacterium]